MANLYVTEYANVGTRAAASLGGFIDTPHLMPREPADANQKVAFTTAAQSAEFATGTVLVRLYADAACHVLFGEDPTATAAHQRLTANTEYWRAVTAGQKVSVYDGAS
ncbi:hypothetical protein [Pseudooceanicola atlanticus]|uniref:hypothetical protein n=1 Tax=Pseudooceanicola atlanticus TaxID=1461694 RepID=UPI00235440E3|nr:hypothetical protein [Pseudooceanicola atlanticus]